jgi:hypothetical protein
MIRSFAEDLAAARRMREPPPLVEAMRREAIAAAPSCPVCGRNVVEAGRGHWMGVAMLSKVRQGRPVYCSNACKQKAYRQRKGRRS